MNQGSLPPSCARALHRSFEGASGVCGELEGAEDELFNPDGTNDGRPPQLVVVAFSSRSCGVRSWSRH